MVSYTCIIMVMAFNASFNNISAILWRSDILVEETRVPGENHWPAVSHWQTLSHNVVSSTSRLSGVWTHNIIGDRYWLHRQLLNQLPYDHDHDGPKMHGRNNPINIRHLKWTSVMRFLTQTLLNNVFLKMREFFSNTREIFTVFHEKIRPYMFLTETPC